MQAPTDMAIEGSGFFSELIIKIELLLVKKFSHQQRFSESVFGGPGLRHVMIML